jgi:hypothetical protein
MNLKVTIDIDTDDQPAEAVLPALRAALVPTGGTVRVAAVNRLAVSLCGNSGLDPYPDAVELYGRAVTDALYRCDDAFKRIQEDSEALLELSIERLTAEPVDDD